MPSRRLKLLLRNFPRKHLFVLSLGGFLFASLLLLSSKTFQEKNVDRDLTSILEIHDLLENIEEQAALSVSLKEAIVKKNDSLYSILNGFSINNLWGSYEKKPFTENSTLQIYQCNLKF